MGCEYSTAYTSPFSKSSSHPAVSGCPSGPKNEKFKVAGFSAVALGKKKTAPAPRGEYGTVVSITGLADDETNVSERFYSIGLGGKGIIEGRDNDTFGVGYYHIDLSDKLGNVISDRFGDSDGIEIFYNIEVTPSIHITPDFQIINPSNESIDTAYVAGMRVKIDF